MAGKVSGVASVTFTLDTTPPPVTFDLSATSDTGVVGDQVTSAGLVLLVGRTDPNVAATLVQTGTTTTSGDAGDFQFPCVSLALGDNVLTVRAVDRAGNVREVARTIRRVAAPAGRDDGAPSTVCGQRRSRR